LIPSKSPIPGLLVASIFFFKKRWLYFLRCPKGKQKDNLHPA
jgi:hypothetical protein